jgi:hypothetical protein
VRARALSLRLDSAAVRIASYVERRYVVQRARRTVPGGVDVSGLPDLKSSSAGIGAAPVLPNSSFTVARCRVESG